MSGTPTIGLLSFLSFGFSIIAAVLAIDMYKLLRTGEFGKTWRLLIIASVMFALLQVLRLTEILNFRAMQDFHLSEIVELCFVMALTYAFYLQRKVFTHEHNAALEAEENEARTRTEYSSPEYSDELDDEDDDETESAPRELHWSPSGLDAPHITR